MYRSTKKIARLFFVLSVGFVGFNVPIDQASAAACNTSGTVGNVTMTVSIPASGEYIVWARAQQATPVNDAFLIEVDGTSCYSVGSSSMSPNTWTWLNYQGSTTSNTMKHTFTSAGQKTIKVFAKQYDTRVDKVLLLGSNEQCKTNGKIPSGDGTNCNEGPPPTTTVVVGDDSASAGGSGSTEILPDIVAENPEAVEKVEYYVDGELKQVSSGAEEFDASILGNGEYELTTKVTYKDGSTGEVTQKIQVQNSNTPLATTKRWFRNNRALVFIIVGFGTLVSVGGSLYFYQRYAHHKNLYLKQHGILHV